MRSNMDKSTLIVKKKIINLAFENFEGLIDPK